MAFSTGRCLLKPLLKRANMTQSELARRTGISRGMIVKYISKSSPMPLERAKNISHVLGCQIDDLYEWVEVGG